MENIILFSLKPMLWCWNITHLCVRTRFRQKQSDKQFHTQIPIWGSLQQKQNSSFLFYQTDSEHVNQVQNLSSTRISHSLFCTAMLELSSTSEVQLSLELKVKLEQNALGRLKSSDITDYFNFGQSQIDRINLSQVFGSSDFSRSGGKPRLSANFSDTQIFFCSYCNHTPCVR